MATTIRWVGHSTFEVTGAGLRLVLDPFYAQNPVAKGAQVPAADWVLVTHDHGDHVADVPAAVKAGARVLTQPETRRRFAAELGVPADRIVEMNVGGTVRLGEKAEATMIHAFHSSDSGTPAGYIVKLDGFTFAHLGDTGLFADLKTFGELYAIDLAMVPIGGHYTMDAGAAAKAVAWLGAKVAVPMHYRTFPVLAQSADGFVAALRREAPRAEAWVPEPGEAREF